MPRQEDLKMYMDKKRITNNITVTSFAQFEERRMI